MTTPEAARRYEMEHVMEHAGRKAAIFNPHNNPVEELPVIYGFNNGGPPGWMSAVLLAEDGTYLGGHTCSSEAYMPADLGVLEGTRPDRHKDFQQHYPNGYRMEFVPSGALKDHERFNQACELCKQRKESEKQR